jgi:hypothetical protein
VSYVELSDRTDFNDRFVDELPSPADLAPGRLPLASP